MSAFRNRSDEPLWIPNTPKNISLKDNLLFYLKLKFKS